jgi:hypothetical protein
VTEWLPFLISSALTVATCTAILYTVHAYYMVKLRLQDARAREKTRAEVEQLVAEANAHYEQVISDLKLRQRVGVDLRQYQQQ